MGLITYALFYLLCRIGLTREKASIFLIILLPFYIILAGGAPSVTRASIMCMVFLLFGLCRIKISGITVLSLVCLGLLVFNPFY
ncbi:ComEC/Rec2 family competence protein, partial [Pseudomonas sp. 2995-1]|uniref:ComEC/Rec2 family competence protein n=1 Tax=Pseudomonas sp. 2995-1 TaxID=1712679 RepID=UPI0034D17685